MHIACVLTCHNRRDTTLQCLRALFACTLPANTRLSVYLVDDASIDGTGAAVRAEFPCVQVIAGSGSLFWSGGMRLAMSHAATDRPAAYLWLNDDTIADRDALSVLLEVQQALALRQPGVPHIVAAATRDPMTGACSYGGLVNRSRWFPWFVRVPPLDVPLAVSTINGNMVLIPSEVVRRIGNIDPVYVHTLGDWDFGLRAARAGCGLWLAPGMLASCAANDAVQRPTVGEGVRAQLRHALSLKRAPWRQWLAFTSRHCGPFWFVHFMQPYAGAIQRGLLAKWQSPRMAR